MFLQRWGFTLTLSPSTSSLFHGWLPFSDLFIWQALQNLGICWLNLGHGFQHDSKILHVPFHFKLEFLFRNNLFSIHFSRTLYATYICRWLSKKQMAFLITAVATPHAPADAATRVFLTVSYSFFHCPFPTLHFFLRKVSIKFAVSFY